MTTVPMGQGAYKRDYAGSPEIKLLNRFVEGSPTNLKEQTALLARPGTNQVVSAAADTSTGHIRRTYSKNGLFNGDLFIVSGGNFYRYGTEGLIQISGLIGSGIPKLTWDSGPGYQHLFISDGLLLQLYRGGSHASGTLSKSSTPTTADVIDIGGTYYSWNTSVDTNSPNGTSSHPWLCNPGSDAFTAMANMLNFTGTPGTDFSTALRGANTQVTATANGGPPATTVTLTAITDLAAGNSIVTTVFSGSDVSFGSGTLTGGGTHQLVGVYVPTGEAINALCTLDHYVMASVANSTKMFFIAPGATTINTLDFFSKESNPDPIFDLLTVGDVFLACGSGSTETWYSTGDLNSPFAPIEGRTEARGIIDGTLVLVKDVPVCVGDDMIVYTIMDGQFQRISNHGIEERIREQLRSEAGLT